MSRGVQANSVNIEVEKPTTSHALLGKGQLPESQKYGYLYNQPKPETGPKDLRDKANTTKDRPTTAAAKKKVKDLPSVLNQVGQNAVHMQNMYPMMAAVNSIMSGLSSGGSEEETTSNKKEILEDALVGALSLLIKKWTYNVVIDFFNLVLVNNNINKISSSYREVVTNALNRIYVLAIENGEDNIPIYEYYFVETIGSEQTPLVILSEVPNMYTQEYYTPTNDPYTGYIKWNSEDETEYVFTVRVIGEKYFTSAVEEVYSTIEENLYTALDIYIENNNLTAELLSDLLIAQNKIISDFLNEKTLGKNSSSGSNAQQLIQSLIGFIGSASSGQQSIQLPFSVLNQNSILQSLKKFEKRQGEHKKMQQKLDKSLKKPKKAPDGFEDLRQDPAWTGLSTPVTFDSSW